MRKIGMALAMVGVVVLGLLGSVVYLYDDNGTLRDDNHDLAARLSQVETQIADTSQGQEVDTRLSNVEADLDDLKGQVEGQSKHGLDDVNAQIVEIDTQIQQLHDCFIEVANQVENGFEVRYGYASTSTQLSTPCSQYVSLSQVPEDSD